MLALKIIGIIVLIVLLISLIRVGAVIEFGEELAVFLAIGPLRLKILPAKEKKEKKKKPPKKKKEKTKKPKEAAPKKKRKITLKQVKELLGILWPALKKTLKRVGRGIRISPLRLSIILGGDDPSKVAETYGWLSQAVWGVMPQLEKLMDIRKPYIHTGFDFDAEKTALSGKAGVTMRIGTGFAIVMGLIGPGIRALMVLTKKEETKTLNTGERKESDYEQAE